MFASPIDPESLPMVRISCTAASPLVGEHIAEPSSKQRRVLLDLLDKIVAQDQALALEYEAVTAATIKFAVEYPDDSLVEFSPDSEARKLADRAAQLANKAKTLAQAQTQVYLRLAQDAMRRMGAETTVQFIPGPSMTPVHRELQGALESIYKRLNKPLIQGRPLRVCAVCCAKVSLTVCTGCFFVYYCCKEHQSLNWELHRPICKQIREKSTVTCATCKEPRSVWNAKIPVFTHAVDEKSDSKFICGKCRLPAEAKHPRKLWAVCKSALRAENLRELIAAHSSPTEKLHVVDL